ncbi:ChaN family lipoprotein [Pseudomonas qingdaonensis]|nr:ChaN family lipoprotein [Pseudomonas qingdaonensis]
MPGNCSTYWPKPHGDGGETHDNVAHHLIEQWLATGLAERRKQGAVVLEMLDSDQQRPVGDVQAWLGAGNRVRLARLRKIMQWDERWSWEQYGPLMQALMQAPAPVLAGNLSPRERKQVAADAPADAASLFPQAAIAEVQRQRIVQMHCGEIDLPRLNAMLAIQHGRDRRMAQVLDAAPAPRLLFAGVLHTLKSQGAPQYLRHSARSRFEGAGAGEEGQAPAAQDADFVWLLPSQDGDGVALAPVAASCDAPLQPPPSLNLFCSQGIPTCLLLLPATSANALGKTASASPCLPPKWRPGCITLAC